MIANPWKIPGDLGVMSGRMELAEVKWAQYRCDTITSALQSCDFFQRNWLYFYHLEISCQSRRTLTLVTLSQRSFTFYDYTESSEGTHLDNVENGALFLIISATIGYEVIKQGKVNFLAWVLPIATCEDADLLLTKGLHIDNLRANCHTVASQKITLSFPIMLALFMLLASTKTFLKMLLAS